MIASDDARSAAARRLAPAIGVAGAGVCLLAALFLGRSVPPEEAGLRGLVEGLLVGVPIAAGVYALRVARTMRFGLILIAVGFAASLTALAHASESVPYSIGRLAAWLVFPSVIYLMLVFPDGRIRRRLDRVLLRSLNTLLWVLYIGSALFVESYPRLTPWASCDRDCPPNAFLVLAHEPAVMEAVVQPLRELLTVGLLFGVLFAMLRRWRAATPLRRRMTRPVTVMSAASTLLLTAFFFVRWSTSGNDSAVADAVGVLWQLSLAGIAAAFAVGLLRQRLLLAEIVGGLAQRLAGELDVRGIRAELASALDDPSLELLAPTGPGRWSDSRGRPATLPAPGGPTAATLVGDDDGNAVLAIVHDAQLLGDDELLPAVGALVRATQQRRRVTTRLAGATAQLAQSRRRIAEAADQERARIERDLHDGAQQRLLALRIRLTLAEEILLRDPAAGTIAVRELGEEVDRTLDELRALAHGVYPATLKDGGLEDALRSLARDAPLPVHVQAIGVTRHPPEIEIAVYFTCAEALQNAIAHAPAATGVWIALGQERDLTLEVRDDGPGFTPPADGDAGAPGHRGLHNMRDRLEAIGGRLTIESAPGRGTRVLGAVPL